MSQIADFYMFGTFLPPLGTNNIQNSTVVFSIVFLLLVLCTLLILLYTVDTRFPIRYTFW